jgi:histidinol-phosphate phosphatase family protein
LIDRDGTLIVDKQYLSDPAGVELLDGVVSGLRRLMAAEFVLAVVTNQSGIGRGYYTESDMRRVNDRIERLLEAYGIRIDGWFFCPHHPDDGCACRKPRRGLADQADQALHLDFSRSFVIGDSDADVGLARSVGATGVRVLTGRPGIPSAIPAAMDADGFEAACRYILAREGASL